MNSDSTVSQRSTGQNMLSAKLIRAILPGFCFLVTTVYLASALNPFLPVKSFIMQITVVGCILVWAYGTAVEGRLRLARTPVDVIMILYLAWLVVTGIYALNRPLWLDQLVLQFCGAAFFYLVVFYFRGYSDIESLMFYMLIPVFFVGALAVLDLQAKSFFPWDFLLVNRYYSIFEMLGVEGLPPGSWEGNFDGRVSASFGNPVYLAGWVVLLLPAAFAVCRESSSALRRIVSLCSVLVLLFLLIATFTRSAWAAAALGAVVFFVLNRRRRTPASAAKAGMIIISAALLVFILFFARQGAINPNYSVAERVTSIFEAGDRSQLQRTLIWKTSLRTIADRPLLGTGAGNYRVFHPWYQTAFLDDDFWRQYASFPDRVHNEFLEMAAETGLPGLALYALLLLSVIRMGKKAAGRGGAAGGLAAGIIAGFAALLFYALFQFPMHIVPVHSYFWLMAGALAALGGSEIVRARDRTIRAEGHSREKAVALVTLALLVCVCAVSLFSATLGHISFFRGIRAENPDDINEAAMLMEKGIASNPGSREMYVRYAAKLNSFAKEADETWERRNLLKKSRDVSLMGTMYHPYEERLYLNAGVSYISLDQPQKAKKMLEYGMVLNPTDPAVIYNLGIAYYMMGLYNKAKYIYKESIETGIAAPGVYQNIGRVHSALGEHDQALEAYKLAMQKQGVSADIFYSMGLSFSALGRREEAVSCYRKALEANPEHTDALGNLAIEKLEAGDVEEALEELGSVLESRPDSGVAMYHIGRAYYRMGNMKTAQIWLKSASEELPGHEGISDLLNSISGKGSIE